MEILQNTILKLIFRQGSDLDRKSVVLASGEPGFTTDTNRLYIGTPDSLSGGVVVGNISHTSTTDPTGVTTPVIGDTVFDSDKHVLYRHSSGDGGTITDWETIGGVYSSGDKYIALSAANNAFYLNPLSANSISSDLLSGLIILTGNGRISLSSRLPISHVSTNTITISSGLVASNGSSNITGISVNPLSSNLIISSNQVYARFNGLSGNPLSAYSATGSTLSTLDFHKNMTDVVRLSAGHYMFFYGPLVTSNLISNVQSYGTMNYDHSPRTLSICNSSCEVRMISATGPAHADSTVTLLISY